MAAKIFRINYKSDFILTLNSDAGWMTPFCIKFWTGAPSQAFFVGWDGTTYTHCSYDPSEPTKLVVQFDDHHLPTGDLKFQIAYHFAMADFPNDTEDEVINPANITTEIDGETYQVMLDFTGETAPEIEFSLPAYANEAQRIANEEQRIADEQTRIDNEAQRIQNEETRINQEQTRQDNEAQRIRNEQTRINQEEARVREFATLKHDAQEATTAANDAAALANQKAQLAADKAQLAADKAALAQDAAALANEKAQLAADKAALANDAAALANEKAALAQQKAEYAKDQGDYAKQQGDYAKEQGDYAKRKGDDAAAQMQQQAQAFSEAQTARQTAYEQAEGTESGSEAGDGSRWGAFKTNEAARDAKVDAKVADITNLQKAVAEGAVYDISANHLTEGVPTKYADLTAALGTDGVNVPVDKRKGGMSIKYIQSSDNKYVQYFLTKNEWSASEADWEKINLKEEVSQLGQVLNIVWQNGFINWHDGVFYEHPLYRATNYVRIEGAEKVIVRSAGADDDAGYAFYNSAQGFISGGNIASYEFLQDFQLNVPSNAEFLRFTFYSQGRADIADAGCYIYEYNDRIIDLQGRLKAVECDGSVTTAKLANSAVITAKIADGAVTDAKLANPVSALQNTSVTDKAVAITIGSNTYKFFDVNSGRFAISWADNTFIDASNGGQYSHSLYDSTDYILVKGIKILEVNTCATVDDSGYAFYTEDKTFISGGHFTSDSVPVINSINVPDNAVYFRYTFYKNQGYDKGVSYADAINVLGCIDNLALSNVVSNESPYTITKTNGYYISDSGVVIDNVDYFVTDAIEFHKGDVITLESRDPSGDAVARMSRWENNNFVKVIALGTTTFTKVVYVVTEDTEYIRFSGYLNTTSYPFDVYLKKLYIGESFTQAVSLIVNPISKNALITEDIVPTLTLVSGHYIAANGGIGESDYFYSESVAFKKGDVITLESRDPSGDAVARISKWTKDGVFVRAIALGTTSLTTVSYTVEDDVEYIRFSGYAQVESYPFNLVTKQTIIPDTFKGAVIDTMSPYLPENTRFWSYAMGNILCIGDSLTEGAYYVSGHAVGSGASIKQNYPYMLGRMLGAEVTNAGYSGISASGWYANHISGYDYMDYDSVIIWLGTNNGLTDTLDTDVDPYSDYHDYANTETGNYCKIIEAIKESNPDIKIFLTKIFASGGSVATTNVVIDKIAAKYGLFVIDNSDLSYANCPALHGNVTDNPHFSKAGNIIIANRFIEKIGKYLSEDPLLCEFGISAFVRG